MYCTDVGSFLINCRAQLCFGSALVQDLKTIYGDMRKRKQEHGADMNLLRTFDPALLSQKGSWCDPQVVRFYCLTAPNDAPERSKEL